MTFSHFCKVVISLVILFAFPDKSLAQLSENFYTTSCPSFLRTVTDVLKDELKIDRRMGASLLRLHFHDCFVNGCDGSILLDDTSNSTGEKNAAPNLNSARGFEVIDKMKRNLEIACKGMVSCADILALAARESVVQLGGPSWVLKFGRKDAKTANMTAAQNNIPPPTMDLNALENVFSGFGFNTAELVALSGAHTIGRARCTTYRKRIYKEINIDITFVKTLRSNCALNDTGDGNNTTPLDAITETTFDNNYYTDISKKQGLLHSDQQLYIRAGDTNSKTNSIVENYIKNQNAFFNDFASAMIKMSQLSPPIGQIPGEIRTNCRRVN